jgi:single-strand DNA-binding protein
MPNTQVSIVGNLTSDPNLRVTNTGASVANFTVAVSDGTRDNPSTSFYDVTAWRDLAEHVVDSLTKGLRVVVVGTLKQRTWEQDGNKRSKVEIAADAVGPDLRFATATVKGAPKQASFPSDQELPTEARRRELVNAARQAVEHPGEYQPGQYGEEPF